MDTLHFAVPKGRAILHHARFASEATPLADLQQATLAAAAAAAGQAPRARHAREVLHRTIDEHALNKKAELFVPRIRARGEAAPAAPFDPLDFFRTATTPTAVAQAASKNNTPNATPSSDVFYYEATVPFSSLLSDAFLSRYLTCGSVFGLSVGTPIDHCNVVQLTPPGLLRMYVDTDAFESLGVEAPSAHSDFAVCSERGARARVRERLLTVDLAAHAKQASLRQAIRTVDGDADKKTDKRLERLRWALSRCAPVRMRLLLLDDSSACLPLDLAGATDVLRIDIAPTVHRFGAGSRVVSVPRVDAFTSLLPSLAVAEEIAQSKLAAKKAKKAAAEAGEEQKEAPDATAASTAAPSTAPSSSFFPQLADGTSSQDIWTDMMTYLGLVHGRMESCLADPNNISGSNIFLQQPLCPHLAFNTSNEASSVDSAAEEDAMSDEEEDIISLAPKKKAKRKRAATIDESANSDPAAATVISAYSVTWTGMLAPSFLLGVVSRARALLASDASIPFVALTVFGCDESITSWRDKQHQVWMAGAGSGGMGESTGGGENHYTVLLLPENDHQRRAQQYVLCTMLGELDRTH